MKSKKTVHGSSCKKGKLFGGLIGRHGSEIDPCYRAFLEHLSKDGKTYVLDMPKGDHGLPFFVRYGEDHVSYGNTKGKSSPNFPNHSRRTSSGISDGKRPDVKAFKAASRNVSCSFSPKRSYLKKKKKKKKKEKTTTSSVDESYELFLSLVKFKDGFMVIEPEPGVTIVYEREEDMPAGYDEWRTGSSTNELPLVSPHENMEENYTIPLVSPHENMEENYTIQSYDYGLAPANEIASELEMAAPSSENIDAQDIICTDERGLVLYAEPSDLNACEDEQATPLAISYGGSSKFDEKLNAVLSQPYDQNEYEELWRKATDRKPVSRQRHLRSASKRYVTEAIGLSYLDYYPDLSVQINSADCDKRLSLLRKFFFWLENLCHEGAYMPWISKPLACNPISPDEYEPMLALKAREDDL